MKRIYEQPVTMEYRVLHSTSLLSASSISTTPQLGINPSLVADPEYAGGGD